MKQQHDTSDVYTMVNGEWPAQHSIHRIHDTSDVYTMDGMLCRPLAIYHVCKVTTFDNLYHTNC